MDLPPSPSDLGNGRVTLQELILSQLEHTVQAEVRWQNHLLFLGTQGEDMREVRELAAGMKEAIASIRKGNSDAKSGLDAEIARAAVNSQKVKAFTQELKEANLEVESFLGETGSNFPTLEGSDTPHHDGRRAEPPPKPDINGVLRNTEGSQ